MKRFTLVLFSLLFVFALVSCGNLTLTLKTGKTASKQAATGTITVKIPMDVQTEAARVGAIVQKKSDVTGIDISVDNQNDSSKSQHKSGLTTAELDEGVVFTVDPGSYRIYVDAYKETANGRVYLFSGHTSSPVTVTTHPTDPVTISMEKYIVNRNNGPDAEAAGVYRYSAAWVSATVPSSYMAEEMKNYNGWSIPGKSIIYWVDESDGTHYVPYETISLNGKELPLTLTAYWGDSEVTYEFNSNHGDTPLVSTQVEVTRYDEIIVPEYKKRTGYKEGVTRGVLDDSDMVNHDGDIYETWYLEDEGNEYYFCGWSVGTPIPILEESNYEENLSSIMEATIVQPGEKMMIKADETVFYAVWIKDCLYEKVLPVLFQYGDGRLGKNANYVRFYLVDALPPFDDGKELHVPRVDNLFPQIREEKPGWNEWSEFFDEQCWYKVDPNTYMVDESVYTYENNSVCIPSDTEEVIYQYRIEIPLLELMFMDEERGEYFCRHVVFAESYHPDREIDCPSIPSISEIKTTFEERFQETFSEPEGQVLKQWMRMGPDLSQPTVGAEYFEVGHEFTEEEFEQILQADAPLCLYAVYEEDLLNPRMIRMKGNTVKSSAGTEGGPFFEASPYEPVQVNSFLIAETELTYNQWYEVYTWATSDDRGEGKYSFAFKGRPGNSGTDGAEPTESTQPVTNISWRDAVVWCNAASEKAGLEPVYYKPDTNVFVTDNVLRVAEDYNSNGTVTSHSTNVESGSGMAERATIDPVANGYRLPTEAEWLYAAWGGDPDDSSSWNTIYAGTNQLEDIAYYSGNSESMTSNVKQKDENPAGLYDMCGNVGEFVWSYYMEGNLSYQNYRLFLGGTCQSNADQCAVGYRQNYMNPTAYYTNTGFRVARSIISGYEDCFYEARYFVYTEIHWTEKDEGFSFNIVGSIDNHTSDDRWFINSIPNPDEIHRSKPLSYLELDEISCTDDRIVANVKEVVWNTNIGTGAYETHDLGRVRILAVTEDGVFLKRTTDDMDVFLFTSRGIRRYFAQEHNASKKLYSKYIFEIPDYCEDETITYNIDDSIRVYPKW